MNHLVKDVDVVLRPRRHVPPWPRAEALHADDAWTTDVRIRDVELHALRCSRRWSDDVGRGYE